MLTYLPLFIFKTLTKNMNKYQQKLHFACHGIPLPGFVDASSVEAIQQAAQIRGLPLMLKARKGGYDGRGNAVLRSADRAAVEEALKNVVWCQPPTRVFSCHWKPFLSCCCAFVGLFTIHTQPAQNRNRRITTFISSYTNLTHNEPLRGKERQHYHDHQAPATHHAH